MVATLDTFLDYFSSLEVSFRNRQYYINNNVLKSRQFFDEKSFEVKHANILVSSSLYFYNNIFISLWEVSFGYIE